MTALTPRPGIMDIKPYVGGKNSADGAGRVIKLASNENDLGPSPKAVEAYLSCASMLHRYPEGGADDLRQAIGEVHGLDPARIVTGCGSDEILTLLSRAYAGPDDHVLYSQYGFLMYPINAKAVAARPMQAPESALIADVDQMLAHVTDRTRIVFLANPNNPTGSLLPASEVRRLHAGLSPSTLLVLDAAYAEYVTDPDYSPGVDLVDAAQNVVMARTFSKIYGLAALRVGWAYCSGPVADVLNRIRNPFNVPLPAQVAATAAVRDQEHVARVRAYTVEKRAWLAGELTAMGLVVHPSHGNFLLVDFPADGPHTAAAVYDQLMADGIILRAMGGYGLPNALRITIGAPESLDALVASLNTILGRNG
ncbi:histidinol-phosphate aminotransferase [Tistrella bauzanensis]|uniref:Histidinol-phosphate aminotransferase n=1 Tax=Tistrella bauzanensis TaxID=657419 RepID=A0ABQ1IEM2_9PROT|nr:histidinol-phosphate transaminase [Tistrella bauzanensis]GGB35527.1 histidinol-phosphate aminotransferase [Tistrella bauzanensis]